MNTNGCVQYHVHTGRALTVARCPPPLTAGHISLGRVHEQSQAQAGQGGGRAVRGCSLPLPQVLLQRPTARLQGTVVRRGHGHRGGLLPPHQENIHPAGGKNVTRTGPHTHRHCTSSLSAEQHPVGHKEVTSVQ